MAHYAVGIVRNRAYQARGTIGIDVYKSLDRVPAFGLVEAWHQLRKVIISSSCHHDKKRDVSRSCAARKTLAQPSDQIFGSGHDRRCFKVVCWGGMESDAMTLRCASAARLTVNPNRSRISSR